MPLSIIKQTHKPNSLESYAAKLLQAVNTKEKEQIRNLAKNHPGILEVPINVHDTENLELFSCGTLLHALVKRKETSMIKLLIELGANTQALNSQRQTPYDMVVNLYTKDKFKQWFIDNGYAYTAAEIQSTPQSYPLARNMTAAGTKQEKTIPEDAQLDSHVSSNQELSSVINAQQTDEVIAVVRLNVHAQGTSNIDYIPPQSHATITKFVVLAAAIAACALLYVYVPPCLPPRSS